MSTLSASALAIVFGVERLGPQGIPSGPAVVVFGLALLSALVGLFFSTTTKLTPRQLVGIEVASAVRFFTASVVLFYVGVMLVLWVVA
jgi:hypothetical protein